MLSSQIRRFIQSERDGLQSRLQALQELEQSLNSHDGPSDVRAFIEREKTPEKAHHQTKALRLLEFSVQYQGELAAGRTSREAAVVASAAVRSMGVSAENEMGTAMEENAKRLRKSALLAVS